MRKADKKAFPRWGFNENSFFIKPWVRYVVYTITALFIIFFPYIMIEQLDSSELIWAFIGSLFVGLIVSYILTSKHIENTEFFDWDSKERKKKTEYSLHLYMVSAFFSILFILSVSLFLVCVKKDMFLFYIIEAPLLVSILRITTPIIFLFNMIEFIHLYSPLWDEYITIGYIKTKPEDY